MRDSWSGPWTAGAGLPNGSPSRASFSMFLLGTMVVLSVAGASAVLLVGAGMAWSRPLEAAVSHWTAGARIAWRSCGKRLQCARVRVPLDWSRPRGQKISLALIRHLASRPGRRTGSMFVNPGGPGQSGVKLVRDNGARFDALGGGRFDVVGWDPRGTNASTPVRCFTSKASEARFWRGVQIPTSAAASSAYRRRTIVLARDCGRVGRDPVPRRSRPRAGQRLAEGGRTAHQGGSATGSPRPPAEMPTRRRVRPQRAPQVEPIQ